MHPIVVLLFAHFVGDFVFQGNKIASLKYRSFVWLTIHVLIYSVVIAVAALIILDWELVLMFTLVNAGLHWVTDFITSRVNHQLNKLENKHWFWLGIGVDQFIHATCLVYTHTYFTVGL